MFDIKMNNSIKLIEHETTFNDLIAETPSTKEKVICEWYTGKRKSAVRK